jgi:hypothetical protein
VKTIEEIQTTMEKVNDSQHLLQSAKMVKIEFLGLINYNAMKADVGVEE